MFYMLLIKKNVMFCLQQFLNKS